MLLAIVLSAVLVVVAIIDQTGGRSLADHVATMYARYGKQPEPSLLYGLVYARIFPPLRAPWPVF